MRFNKSAFTLATTVVRDSGVFSVLGICRGVSAANIPKMSTSDEEVCIHSMNYFSSCGPGRGLSKALKWIEEVRASDPTLDNNPLLDISNLPRYSSIQASHVEPGMKAIFAKGKEKFEIFEETLQNSDVHDFETVVDELEVLKYASVVAWIAIQHLSSVANSNDLREAYKKTAPFEVEFTQRILQSEALYDAYSFLAKDEIREGLTEPQNRAVDITLKDMKLAGLGLKGEDKIRFNDIEAKLSILEDQFQNNLLDFSKQYSIVIKDRSRLDGVPGILLDEMAASALAVGEKDSWLVTLALSIYVPFWRHCKDRALREELFRAFTTRASKGDLDNSEIIKEILKLKTEKSKLLGYNTSAEVSMVKKTIGSVDAVNDLHTRLRRACYPAAMRDLVELKEFASKQGFEDEIRPWDLAFWMERHKDALFGVTDEELRPYFSLENVLIQLFKVANSLFGIDIKEVEHPEVEVWHPDVRFFNVFREGHLISSFYFDLFSRPETKRGGAWVYPVLLKSHVTGANPVININCNFPNPVDSTPSLLSLQEVQICFHEFGHALQHMLTTITNADVSGLNGVEFDAMEFASQFMEPFVTEPSIVQWTHYKTGESLPTATMEKLRNMKKHMSETLLLRDLLFLGAVDMELHHDYDAFSSETTPQDVFDKVAEDYPAVRFGEAKGFLCQFHHIFADIYTAGYYSYVYSLILSLDAHQAFQEVGMDNKQEIAMLGKRFADTVLALGGGKHPLEVFKLFRGREPRHDAFLEYFGLLQ